MGRPRAARHAAHRLSFPGRICLIGENLDWMGLQTLVSCPKQLRISARLLSSDATGLAISSRLHGRWYEARFSKDVLPHGDRYTAMCTAVLNAVRQRVGADTVGHVVTALNGRRIHLTTLLPTAGGLASSAAFCVTLAASLWRAIKGDDPTPNTLAELAYTAEHKYLAIPCGRMDQYAIALGGTQLQNFMSPGPPVIRNVALPPEAVFLVAWGGTPDAEWKDLGISLQRDYSRGEQHLARFARETAGLVTDAEASLNSNPERAMIDLGSALDEAQQLISKYLGAQDPQLLEACSAAKRAGAYGAKTLGMRRAGGCMVALVSHQSVETVYQVVHGMGLYSRLCTPDNPTSHKEMT